MPDHSNGTEPIVVAGAGYTGQRLLNLLDWPVLANYCAVQSFEFDVAWR